MKWVILVSISIAVVSYYVVTKSIYDAETRINDIISFALFAIMGDPAISALIEPIHIDKLIDYPFLSLRGFSIKGLSNVSSGNESKLTFDGEDLGIHLDIRTREIEASISYELGASILATKGTVKILLDSMNIDVEFVLPTNYTGQPVLKKFEFNGLEGFRSEGPLSLINGILSSGFFKKQILGMISKFAISQVNGRLLRNVTLPWQDEKLKAKLKRGVTDTGFLIA